MISETKLDSSFSEGQFSIPGYSAPYRRAYFSVGRKIDRNSYHQLCQESSGFGFKLFLAWSTSEIYDTILIDGISSGISKNSTIVGRNR